MRKRLVGAVWLGLLALGVGSAQAQARGTISGTVVDDATNQPLSNVQVFVTGTALGTLTNAEGRFLLVNVPSGTQVVNANRLGYSSATERVAVTGGQTANVAFRLSPSAVALDEIVVTGTAGAVQRRAQPAVVASVDVSEVIDRGTATSVQDVLTARVPGVAVTGSSGTSGTAQQIRIRGASSISLSNEPLVFIDGVRADSRVQSNNAGGGLNVGGQGMSRLFDLNPEDIESVEVVKGPAAATLYGADASAGVIQIITKKGRTGSNRFSQNISLEYNDIDPNFDPPANFGRCTAALVANAASLCAGRAVGDVVQDNPLQRTGAFRNGQLRSLGYSARGGGENYGYFVSLGLDEEEGTLPNNEFQRRTGRVNFNFIPTPTLSIDAGVGIFDVLTELPINDNNIYGFLGGGLLGRPTNVRNTDGVVTGGFFAPNREFEAISSIESVSDAFRFTPTLQVNYTPFEWFRNRLVLGGDFTRGQLYQFFPLNNRNFYGGDTDTGDLQEIRTNNDIITVDYLGTIQNQLRENVSSNLSFGLQLIDEVFDRVTGEGTGFVTNANRVVGAASQITASQGFAETRQIGLLGQWDVGFNDRLFIQLGARVDQNSSFGENAEPFFLPKIGASWVVSEEDFFTGLSNFVPTLRLRAAYGTTGRSPQAGASLQTFDPRPFAVLGGTGSAAGVVPLNPGNINLKPERGEEFEAGFDAGLLGERLGLEFTYFNKTTRDLLLQRPVPPSSGFIEGSASNPFENIGEVRNSGVEYALRGSLVNSENIQWEARVAGSTLDNELVDLGEVAPFGTAPRFAEGRPLGFFSTRQIREVITTTGDSRCPLVRGVRQPCAIVADSNEYVGNSLPTYEGNFSSTMTLFKVLQISGQVDWKGGHTIYNNTAQFRDRSFANSERGVLRADLVGQEEALRRFGPFVSENGGNVPFTNVNVEYYERADYARLRELAATLFLPQQWAGRLGASTASLTVGGRNLALWTDYSGSDPEVLAQATRNTGSSTFERMDFLTVPQPRRLVLKMNLSF